MKQETSMTLETTHDTVTVTGKIKRTNNSNYQQLLDILKDIKVMVIKDSFCITSDITIMLKANNVSVKTFITDIDDLLTSLGIQVQNQNFYKRKYSLC